MLINFSNHPSSRWSENQKQAVYQIFGELYDLPFPAIPPEAEPEGIIATVKEYLQECLVMFPQPRTQRDAIHVMGEMTFVYQFVKLATAVGLRCVASTTERIAVDHPDGTKTSEFRFIRFRDYDTF